MAREHIQSIRAGKLVGIEPEFLRKWPVESDQPGFGHRLRIRVREEALGQLRIAVVEGEKPHLNALGLFGGRRCRHEIWL